MSPTPAEVTVIGTLQAFKVARIVAGPNGLAFAGAGVDATYGAADQATCIRDPRHVPPHPGCACGFYALHDRCHAVSLLSEHLIALLEVELWGRFHEYERGYIAAAQLVRSVTLVAHCIACLLGREDKVRPPVGVGRTLTYGQQLAPVCDEHQGKCDTIYTLGELAAKLGTAVTWAGEADPVTEAALRIGLPQQPLLPRNVRRLDSLLPGETAHVFQSSIAQDEDGDLWIDVLARLIRPLPGTDVPIRLTDAGEHEALLAGLRGFEGWRPRIDVRRFALPLRVAGVPETRAGL